MLGSRRSSSKEEVRKTIKTMMPRTLIMRDDDEDSEDGNDKDDKKEVGV